MEETTRIHQLVQATLAMEEPATPTKEATNHLEPRTIPFQVLPIPQATKQPSYLPNPSSEA